MRIKHPASLYAPLLLLAIILLTDLSNSLLRYTETYHDGIFLSMTIVQFVVFLLPSAFYSRMRGIKGAFIPSLMPVRFFHFPLVLFGMVVYILGSLLLMCLGYYVHGESYFSITSVLSIPIVTDNAYLLFSCLAFVPALLEELVFRCLFLREYTSMGGFVAVMTSGLFFALIHYSPEALPLLLFMGILLGALTYITHSVLPAVLLHMATNVFLLFFEDAFIMYLNRSAKTMMIPYLLGLFLCFFLFFFFARCQSIYTADPIEDGEESRIKSLEKLTGKTEEATRAAPGLALQIRQAVFSPGFILVAAICILKFIQWL